MQQVWTIERSLWLDGVEAYRTHMADQCVMVFGPVGILTRDQILQTIEGAPRWQEVEMAEPILATTDGSTTIVIAYRAEARRAGADPYRALCSSTYFVQDGELRLAQHQQTPI